MVEEVKMEPVVMRSVARRPTFEDVISRQANVGSWAGS